MEKSFVMLVGLPGSGKSTMAQERFTQDDHTVIVSVDAFLDEIAREKGIPFEQAFDLYMPQAGGACAAAARKAFSEGKRVIWDQCNLTIDDRARKLLMAPADYFKVAIAFELSNEELTDRVVARMHETGKSVKPQDMVDMAKSYERPGRFEGFDYVEIINE